MSSARRAAVDERGVGDEDAAGGDQGLVFIERGQVEDDGGFGVAHQGRADLFVGDDDGAVGGAAAHLGAVGGDPGDGLAAIHAGVGENLPGEEGALPAKSSDHDLSLHRKLSSVILNVKPQRSRRKSEEHKDIDD